METSGSTEDNLYLQAEALLSKDVRLQTWAFQYFGNLANGDSLRIEGNTSRMKIDYTPPDEFLVGYRETTGENSLGANLQYEKALSERASMQLSTGYSEGFSNYRSLWIDTYYRQLFENFPAYVDSSPYSAFAELIYSNEFLPSTGIILAGITYQYEKTATIWDIDLTGKLEPANDINRVGSLYGAVELLLNRRNRVRGQAWIRSQTNRDPRLTISASLRRAVKDNLFLHATYGHTREGKGFRANGIYLEMEKEISPEHSLSLYLSGYKDTGEIEDALSSVQLTAPDTKTWELGIKYHFEHNLRLRISCYAGYFSSVYSTPSEKYAFTSSLYSDREWLSIGFSTVFFY